MRIHPGLRFDRWASRSLSVFNFAARRFGTDLALLEKEMSPVKIEIPFLAALVLIGTSLSARVAGQGVEQALLSTVIEYSLNERMRKVVFALVGRLCFVDCK